MGEAAEEQHGPTCIFEIVAANHKDLTQYKISTIGT